MSAEANTDRRNFLGRIAGAAAASVALAAARPASAESTGADDWITK